ncbi:Uncharacterised protein [Klebsiella pneumoniae]|uniref:Uncharacterized protein n=1 Tax=Klebsiella pneumoniae TaxID=573 RepID=A0A378AW36_KLEPN|nr:Uncharacterised protein [Klebsiella pneumoniae]
MAGGANGRKRQGAVGVDINGRLDFLEVGIFNALQDLLIQQFNSNIGARFAVGLGEDRLQAFKRAVGD